MRNSKASETNTFLEVPSTSGDGNKLTLINLPNYKPNSHNEIFRALCSKSKYEDNTWEIDLMFPDKYLNRGERIISFTRCIPEYLNDFKEYALTQLLNKTSPHSIRCAVTSVNEFANVLHGKPISDANEIDVAEFYSILFGNNHVNLSMATRRKKWVEVKYFMTALKYDHIRIIMEKYNISNFKKERADRYIPDDIAKQLDIILMRNQSIPVQYKFIYWSLRLLVNRITEVLNCEEDCLKQFSSDTYTISIPTYKQEGPYQNTIRMMYIKYEGIGKMYIDTVKEAIEAVKKYADRSYNHICYVGYTRTKWDNNSNELVFKINNNSIRHISPYQFNSFLKKICKYYGIKDENGHLVNVTTHCFRHNSVTDRIDSGIFRDVDVQAMSFHANTEMINKAYYHPETLQSNNNAEIGFNGRIIKNEQGSIQKVLNKPYAIRIRDLGICSDTRSCSKEKSQCLFCKYMIPDYDNLDLYYEQRAEWNKKKILAVQTQNKDYEILCNQWINGYNLIIEKVISYNQTGVEK